MKNKIDFSKLPVGTNVWDMVLGHGKISGIIVTGNDPFPICVWFQRQGSKEYLAAHYSRDGRREKPYKRSLFLQEFKIEIPDYAYELPRPNLKVDDKIMVSHSGEAPWYKRHFSNWEGGGVAVFNSGCSAWASEELEVWPFWKLPK